MANITLLFVCVHVIALNQTLYSSCEAIFFRLARCFETERQYCSQDVQASYSRFMSMSYQHYFKHDVHERGYDHDITVSRNNGYMTPSLTSPVAVKQEPRDLTYDNGKTDTLLRFEFRTTSGIDCGHMFPTFFLFFFQCSR